MSPMETASGPQIHYQLGRLARLLTSAIHIDPRIPETPNHLVLAFKLFQEYVRR